MLEIIRYLLRRKTRTALTILAVAVSALLPAALETEEHAGLYALGGFVGFLALEMLLGEEPGVEVVGTASEAKGLLALVQAAAPDLVLLDWELPGRPPAEVLAETHTADCQPALVVLDKDAGTEKLVMEAGAAAFVLKGSPPEHLLTAVRQVRSERQPSNSPPKREE